MAVASVAGATLVGFGASPDALSLFQADAGGAEGDVCAGVAVAGASGAGVEVYKGAVGDEGAEVVGRGKGVGVGVGAGGEKDVGEVVFGFHQVAFSVLEAFEYEVRDATGGGRGGNFARFGARARLIGAGDWGGFVGGAVDAEFWISIKCVDDIVPEIFEVVDRPGSVENSAVGGLVAELQREIFPLANRVFDVDLCVIDVEVDGIAVLRKRGNACVKDLRHFDICVKIDVVVGLGTAATACELHWSKLGSSANNDGARAALMVHKFHKGGAG